MGTIDSMKSILTQSALDVLCEKFHIPDTVHPELPGRNDRIHNSPTIKSLSVIAVTKVDASIFPLVFPWHTNKTLRKDPHPTPIEFNADLCEYLANNPAPFRKFSEPFLCLSRYYDLDENCYSTFWTDDDEGGCALFAFFDLLSCDSICLFSLYAKMDLFAFINHVDPTKVRIEERMGVVPDVGNQNKDAQDAKNNIIQGNAAEDQEIPIDTGVIRIDDIVSATVAEKPKVQKRRRKADSASGSNHPPKKLKEDHGTFDDVGASTGGKSLAAIQELFEQSTLNVEVGVTAVATVPFVTSSVTPTPERGDDRPTDFVSVGNLLTQRPSKRFVISSDSSHDSSTNATDDEVTSIVRSFVSSPPLMIATTATKVVVETSSVLVPRVGHEPVHHTLFANPLLWVRPTKMLQLLVEFSVGATRQTCLNSEVRLRLKHELKGREKFKGKFAMHAGWLKERDAKIASPQASELNGLKERNAALEGQVATLESAVVVKDTELASSSAQIAKVTQDLSNLQLSCEELSINVASLECEKDNLIDLVSKLEGTCSGLRDEVMGYKLFKEQIEVIQDEQVKVLSDKVVGLDADLIGMALHLDEEFYPCYLTTIAIRRWILSHELRLVVMKCLESLEYLAALGGAIGRAIDKGMQDALAAGIDYGKVRRGLAEVVAYNPAAEANYVADVNALCVIDFPLLNQLASYKDASMSDLMDLLCLEGLVAETSETSQL
ncbi:hypothetical protein Tco_1169968 [Tanacetum coccineum]